MESVNVWMPLVVLGLLALAAREAWLLWMGFRSLHWVHTTGTLLHIWQEGDFGPPEEGGHSVHARYTYSVAGRAYEGRRMSYRPVASFAFGEALDLLHGRRKGTQIDVFYDPARPERAVILPGTGPANIVGLATLLVLAVLCAWAWMARF